MSISFFLFFFNWISRVYYPLWGVEDPRLFISYFLFYFLYSSFYNNYYYINLIWSLRNTFYIL